MSGQVPDKRHKLASPGIRPKAAAMPPPVGHFVRRERVLDPNFLTASHGSFAATPLTLRDDQGAWRDRTERQPPLLHKAVSLDDVDFRPLRGGSETACSMSITFLTDQIAHCFEGYARIRVHKPVCNDHIQSTRMA